MIRKLDKRVSWHPFLGSLANTNNRLRAGCDLNVDLNVKEQYAGGKADVGMVNQPL